MERQNKPREFNDPVYAILNSSDLICSRTPSISNGAGLGVQGHLSPHRQPPRCLKDWNTVYSSPRTHPSRSSRCTF